MSTVGNYIDLPVQSGGGGGAGTVTSITAGTGITLSPSPIVGTGSVSASTNNLTVSLTAGFDGGGTPLIAGKQARLYIPYGCTISAVTMLADVSGSAVVDIWKAAYASYPPTISNTITASDLPTISSAVKSQDVALTGWTKTVSAGDTMIFNLNSATTITQLAITLTVSKT